VNYTLLKVKLSGKLELLVIHLTKYLVLLLSLRVLP